MEIKNRFTDNVIAEGENAKEICVKNKANLYGANLYGANLYGANLYGANLYGANLYGAKWDDALLLKYLTIGPIGSRNDYLQIFITDKQTIVKTGCFNGTLEDFEKAVDKNYSENKHGKHYKAAINLIKVMQENV
jgi:hypothetical protein